MKARLVLVGNGMAGVRALEELLKIAPDLYDITVFGAEPTQLQPASCCRRCSRVSRPSTRSSLNPSPGMRKTASTCT